MPIKIKGVDASGQPYTMIRDREGTRYEYPEGKTCWSGFNNELGRGGGLGRCSKCDKNTHVTCAEHPNHYCKDCTP